MVTFTSKTGQILLSGKNMREPVSVKSCKDCIIQDCTFKYDKTDTTLLTISDCQNIKILNCKFSDKTTLGLFLKIMGGKCKGILVDGCEFYNHPYNRGNGGEPVRIGNSSTSGCDYDCTFQFCYFHDLKSDVETISVKGCNITIKNCLFERNSSRVTFRHGGYNRVLNNVFRGSGGIRILGRNEDIIGNYFEANPSKDYNPIVIDHGNREEDPNFDSNGKPSGREGKSHAYYARTKNCTIRDNTFVRCPNVNTQWGRGYSASTRNLAPIGCTFSNNQTLESGMMLNFTDAKSDGNTFKDNVIYGKDAKPGELPSGSYQVVNAAPSVVVPDVVPPPPEPQEPEPPEEEEDTTESQDPEEQPLPEEPITLESLAARIDLIIDALKAKGIIVSEQSQEPQTAPQASEPATNSEGQPSA